MTNGEGRADHGQMEGQAEVGEVCCCCCYYYYCTVWVGGWKREEGFAVQRSLGALGRKVVRVWDGAGRCNGLLIEMGRAVVERMEKEQTDRHHETTRPGLRTDGRTHSCWQQAKQTNDSATQTATQTQTQARPGDTGWDII